MNIDLIIFNSLNNLTLISSYLNYCFIFFAKYIGYFLIVFTFYFLVKDFNYYKKMPFLAIFSGFFARYAVVEVIRLFFYRPRPFVDNLSGALINHETTSSFPSGHAAFFFALSTIVFCYNRKAGYFFFITSFFIGFSRIVSAVHWPTDIIVGAIIGVLTGLIVIKIFKK